MQVVQIPRTILPKRSSGSGPILSFGPETKVLTVEQATRSVVVTNIASQTASEDIIIYFQRKRIGGGDIDRVHIPQKGTAVVTFESNEGLCESSFFMLHLFVVVFESELTSWSMILPALLP